MLAVLHMIDQSIWLPRNNVMRHGCFQLLSNAGLVVLQESLHTDHGCGSLAAVPPSLHLQGPLETMAHLQGLSEGPL